MYEYLLGRDVAESIRLDAQHLLWRLHQNHLLHPSIEVTEGLKIAELGCGTAIWLLDLAAEVPSNVELYGFDISSDQFPLRELWPDNMVLDTMDALSEVPPSWTNQFDVVHLRMWAAIVTPATLPSLLKNIFTMLKPGGYIQWEDADITRQVVKGVGAMEFADSMRNLYEKSGLDFSWVSMLPIALREAGFSEILMTENVFRPSLVQLCTNTYLYTCQGKLEGIERRIGQGNLTHSHQQTLRKLVEARASGIVYNWGPTSVLAQKPF